VVTFLRVEFSSIVSPLHITQTFDMRDELLFLEDVFVVKLGHEFISYYFKH